MTIFYRNQFTQARIIGKKILSHIPDRLAVWILSNTTALFMSLLRIKLHDRPVCVMERRDLVARLRDGGIVSGFDNENGYEVPFSELFISMLGSGSVLLDVGASHGLYGVIASQYMLPKNIHCFEPDPLARWILCINNDRYCKAQMNIVHSFVVATSQKREGGVTLDDYCNENNIKPTLVKMDIEGAETEAILGMERVLTEYRPVILMELHERKIRNLWNRDPQELLEKIRSYGYRLRFNGHHWHYAKTGTWDYEWHSELPNSVNYAVFAEPE